MPKHSPSELNRTPPRADWLARTLSAVSLAVATFTFLTPGQPPGTRPVDPSSPKATPNIPGGHSIPALTVPSNAEAATAPLQGALAAMREQLQGVAQQCSSFQQALQQVIKVQYHRAPDDPAQADCIESEPLPDGTNTYHYAVVPLTSTQEVLEVFARVPPEGAWQETADWEIRGGNLYLLAGQYHIRTDGDTTTREYLKSQQEFRIVYR